MSVSTLQQTPVQSEKDHASIRSISSLERNAIQYALDYERFQDPKLTQQRALINDVKQQELATLSVVAKLERAIGRRYSMQDAEFTSKQRKPSVVSTGAATAVKQAEVAKA